MSTIMILCAGLALTTALAVGTSPLRLPLKILLLAAVALAEVFLIKSLDSVSSVPSLIDEAADGKLVISFWIDPVPQQKDKRRYIFLWLSSDASQKDLFGRLLPDAPTTRYLPYRLDVEKKLKDAKRKGGGQMFRLHVKEGKKKTGPDNLLSPSYGGNLNIDVVPARLQLKSKQTKGGQSKPK